MSRLALLYQVAEHVNSTLDLRECLDRIIDGAHRIFGADKLSLMLLDDDAREMRIVAARNIPDDVVAKTVVKLGAGFSGKVAESGEALVVGDIEGDSRSLRREERQYHTSSFAVVPLKHKDRVLGVINLTNRADGRPFCEEDLDLLTALANQAAIAIENSRLITQINREKEQLRRTAFESKILYQVSSSIKYGLGYQHLIELLSASLHDLVDYDAFCSLLVLRGDEDFQTHVRRDVPENYVRSVQRRLVEEFGCRPCSAVVSERLRVLRETLVRADASPEGSVIAVPLEARGQVIGMVCVASRSIAQFPDEDRALLEAIVRQMGETIERLRNTIRGEQDKMQSMVASMAEGVLMFDVNDELVVLNPKARSMLGLPAEEEFTKESLIRSVVWSDIRSFLAKPAQADAAVKEFQVGEEPEATSLVIAVTPVRDASGAALGRLAVIRDVTRERELERMKSDFLSIVSHELRTPLTSIKMFTNNLLDGVEGELNEGQRDTLARVARNLERLSRLINDLLDLSKLEAGKMEIRLAPVNVQRALTSIVEIFSPGAASKKIALDVSVPGGLPVLWADPDRLDQVMTNLLGNALKFTPEGGRITVSARWLPPKPPERIGEQEGRSPLSGEGWVAISVADTGPGIAEDDLERVFDKFYQTDHSMTRKTGGTGLGLAITREIVAKHGGRIWAESAPGKGSTFRFEIPVDGRKHDRAQLYSAIEREMRRARRYRDQFSVLMLDIDDFTGLNETHGYPTGDTALALCHDMVREEVRRLLRERVRETDIVGRFGGDEFLIVAPETDETGARGFGERLRRLIQDHEFVVGEKRFRTTVSIGVTSFHDDDMTPTAPIRRAAAALARAKEGGKNRVC